MAKRMTEVEKWKDPWFSNLTNDEKIVWLFLLDDCNHAGIWQVNLRRLNFECRTQLTQTELSNLLQDRIVVISDEKWFIPKFVSFQYKDLNSKSKPIVSVVDLLSKEGLIEVDSKGLVNLIIPNSNPTITLNKGLDKGYDTTKDKDKDKDKELDMDKFKDKFKDMDKSKDTSKDVSKDKEKDMWNWSNQVNYGKR